MTERIRAIVVVNFDNFHPLNKTVSAEVRAGAPLKWIRWETDSHRDADLLDLPSDERWLWPVLLGLAGKHRREPDGSRVVRMSDAQLAREGDLTEAQVSHALAHLLKRERIRFTSKGGRAGGRDGGEDHLQGGDGRPAGGYVPTYRRTDRQTDLRTATSDVDMTPNGAKDEPLRVAEMAGMLQRVRSA